MSHSYLAYAAVIIFLFLLALAGILIVLRREHLWREHELTKIRESEARYRQMVEYSYDGILVHVENIIVFANKTALCMLGATSPDQVVGQEVYRFFPPSIHDEIGKRIDQISHRKEPVGLIDQQLLRIDGGRVDAEVTAIPVSYESRTATLFIVHDISRRKKAEEALAMSKERQQKIIGSISDIIGQTDERLTILYISPACLKIIGYSPERLVGKSILTLIHPEDRQRFILVANKSFATRNSAKIECRHKHADGHDIWLEWVINVLGNETEAANHTVFVARNITSRKQAEEMIAKQERLLQGVAEATKLLLTASDPYLAIEESLALFGEILGVGRVYVFECHVYPETGEQVVSLRFEWTRGFVERQIDNPIYQNMPYEKSGYRRWHALLSAGCAISKTADDLTPAEREELVVADIVSILVVPIFLNGAYWGFIGFDYYRVERNWSKNEKAILTAAAACIGGAFERSRTERELEQANRKLQELSSLDGLTGLANRRYLDDYLEREWRSTLRFDSPLAVIMLDIDFFKKYNDTYGHQGGDDCLKQVAAVLSQKAKRPADLVARYGGEEFVVLLPDTDYTGAAHVAEELRSSVEELQITHEKARISPFVTVSIGVAVGTGQEYGRVDDLLAAADKALYQAKQNGRNQVVVFYKN